MRTDIHRPSVIEPADYEFVACEHIKIEGLGDCLFAQQERAKIKAHMECTGGTYSAHEHKGNCMVCGAHCIYTALFFHEKTNAYVRTGFDCAGKMHIGDPDLFRKFREAIQAAMKHRAGKLKAEGVLIQNDLDKAWSIYLDVCDGFQLCTCEHPYQGWHEETCPNSKPLPFEERTIHDIVGKLVKYGNASEKQLNFLKVLVNRIDNRAFFLKKREEEKANAKDVPEGRLTVKCEVIKTEYRETQFGEVLKMLVKADDGFRLWGTVPSALQIFDAEEKGVKIQRGLKRGDKIEITATLERSKDDSKFGFFKRPHGKVLELVK